jgi:hypothetical protein
MTDPLTEKIQQARAERDHAVSQRDAWQRRVDIGQARVEALEQAAQLRPLPRVVAATPTRSTIQNAVAPSTARKGRQPGAISKNWRIVLLAMAVYYPAGATEQDIVKIVQNEEIDDLKNLRPRDAARQMAKYQELGYVEAANALLGTWRITEAACQRFNELAEIATRTHEAETATECESVAVAEPLDAERV